MTRRQDILDRLAEHEFQSVAALAGTFGVTASTVRRDLGELEKRGLVRRTRGGALPVRRSESSFDEKETQRPRGKAAIGRATAARIQDGQTVLLDSGTTTLEVARHLTAEQITVVTNDLQIGLDVARRRSANLVFIGGELLRNDTSMWGPTSIHQLQHLRVDLAVIGCDTVKEDGLYRMSSYETELKRLMVSIAAESYFVADSSKFGRKALFKCFDLAPFAAGITDDGLAPEVAADFPVPLERASVDQW